MRVGVHVGHRDAALGGGHTFTNEVLRGLLDTLPHHEHEYVVITSGPPDPTAGLPTVRLDRTLGDRVVGRIRHAGRRLLGGDTADAGTTWIDRRLRDAGIDLVWCLGPGAPTRELPYITVVWDLQHRLQPYFPEVSAHGVWAARERSWREELGRAAVVVVGTERGRQEVERFYGVAPERLHVLPHPTPSDCFPGAGSGIDLATTYGLDRGYLLYPAQFWPHKNHVGLLHALRSLRERHGLEPTAVLVGADAGNRAHVERAVEALGLGGQVRILGFVPREHLLALYQGAGALTYLSLFGPENLPPLEAFAIGCPVIAADVPGADEQLGDAAVRVDPLDEHALADAIRDVLSDTALRERLIARGRERAGERTGRRYVEGVLRAVDDLARIRRTWDRT